MTTNNSINAPFPFTISQGGTNSTSQTNNGIVFFNGSIITSNSNFIFDGSGIVTLSNNSGSAIFNLIRQNSTQSAQLFFQDNAGTNSWTMGIIGTDNLFHLISPTPGSQVTINTNGNIASTAFTASQLVATDSSKTMISGNLSGDITSLGLVTTITNNAVTYAKFQQVAANSIVGNPTGSLANSQAIAFSSTGGTSNIVSRDSNGNSAFNNDILGQITSTGGSTVTLTAASAKTQIFSAGAGTSTIILPNATTLSKGHTFYINNNTSSGVTVEYSSAATFITVPAAGYVQIILTDNSTSAGTWDAHWLFPLTGGITSGLIYMSNGLNAGYRFSNASYPFSAALGDIPFGSASNTISMLSGNTTSTKQYLSQTGTGSVSSAPIWSTISGSDITGSAMTSVNDTNITLTLGGSPSNSLLQATSLTMGWTGTLGVARGGTGTGTSFTQGSVIFAGASGVYSQSNTTFFWDNAGTHLYLGANSSSQTFQTPGVLNLYGTDGTTNNSLKFYTTADGYTGLSLFHDAHNNQAINFDAFWNGTNNVSSYSGSNFQISHQSNQLQFNYNSGIAQGSTFNWTNGIYLDISGNVVFSNGSLTLAGANKFIQFALGDSDKILMYNSTNLSKLDTSSSWNFNFRSGNSGTINTGLFNWYVSGASGWTNQMSLSNSGNLTLNSGNLIINTATSGYQQKSAAVSAGTANAILVTGVILSSGASGTINNSAVTTSHVGFANCTSASGTITFVRVTCGSGTFTVNGGSLDNSTYAVVFIKAI